MNIITFRVHEAPSADQVARAVPQVPAPARPHCEAAGEVTGLPSPPELREEDVGGHQDPVARPQDGGAEEVQETEGEFAMKTLTERWRLTKLCQL